MAKKLFFRKKNNRVFIFFLILLIFLIIYIISFLINTSKNYFVIKNIDLKYYIIPKDKEGEKVNFINKKSLNDVSKIKDESIFLNNIDNVSFSIQLYSNNDYFSVKEYKDNLINLKSEFIDKDDLYIFAVYSDIGTDYFLSYKNFSTKNIALNYCNKSNYIKKCLILNLQN
tara:strand:- start:195 stop:707 length:513 start_codon:yes stop_codon:yes gene_type:complete